MNKDYRTLISFGISYLNTNLSMGMDTHTFDDIHSHVIKKKKKKSKQIPLLMLFVRVSNAT